ncbi:MAG: DUF3841 domain-containing protein [Lachnospirales bacterium]
MECEKIKLYTAQSKKVIDTLKDNGVYYVKKQYILQKYGGEASIFLEAYNWFTKNAVSIIPKPFEAEYPIWLFTDINFVERYEDCVVVELEVELENVILFEDYKWNKIQNLSYIPLDDADYLEYNKILQKQGIKNEVDVYLTNFYPLLKNKVRKSWERLFEGERDLSKQKRAALWQIKGEWILSVDGEKW